MSYVLSLEELKKQRDLLDLRIKRLDMAAEVKETVAFTILMHFRDGSTGELRFSKCKRVSKLKATLVEILND